jgi:hypothetical protein
MSKVSLNHYELAQKVVIQLDYPEAELSVSELIALAQLNATLALVQRLEHIANWAVNNG